MPLMDMRSGTRGQSFSYDGKTWTPQVKGVPKVNLYGVYSNPRTPGKAWAVGDVSGNAPVVLYTKNGGQQWNMASKPPDKKIAARSVDFSPNAQTGFIVGDLNLGAWRSEDGGDTWTEMKVSTKKGVTSITGRFARIEIVGDQTLKKGGDYELALAGGGDNANFVYYGYDPKILGMRWYLRTRTPNGTDGLTGVSFVGDMNGWIVSKSGGINSTNNAGLSHNWPSQTQPKPQKGLNAIAMFPAKPKLKVDLGGSTSPESGTPGVTFVSVTTLGVPDGNVNPTNVIVELSTTCHEMPSATTFAVSVASGSDNSKFVSFLLPSGLTSGQYFVSISDSEEGDANFESSNCSAVNVTN